jgi:hypothetical protein
MPAVYYAASGSETSLAPGYVHYWRAGLGPPTTPTPGFAGDWHFGTMAAGPSVANPSGTYDRSFGELGNTVRLTLPAAGHVIVHTIDHASNGATVTVTDVVTATTLASGPSGTDLELDATSAQLALDVTASAATGWDGVTLGEDDPDPGPGPEPPPYEAPEPGQAIVEIYVVDPDGYRWDVAEWDEATWSDSDWVSITEYCIYAELTWGTDRPDAGILADQVAGLWVIETHDPDRVLDPGNAESPFYPQLLPDLPIRINHNSRTVRTGVVATIMYYHGDEGGRINATDTVSSAARAQVPPGTELSDTFFERAQEAINESGLQTWVHFPASDLMDRPLAPVDPDTRRSAWKVIQDAARELLAVPWVDRDGSIRVTEWDADTDRGLVIPSSLMLADPGPGLLTWVSHDGLYSVVRATDEADVLHESRAVPLPAYGERVYERQEPTIDALAWTARVLADRKAAILRHRPGTVRPLTSTQNDALVDMELMDLVTIDYPETDPPITVRGRVLGVKLRVTDRTKRLPAVLTRWDWTLLTTVVPSAPLVADDDPLVFLTNDDDPTDYLYPDGVTEL